MGGASDERKRGGKQGRMQDICKGGSIKLKAGGSAPPMQMLKGILFFHSLIFTDSLLIQILVQCLFYFCCV